MRMRGKRLSKGVLFAIAVGSIVLVCATSGFVLRRFYAQRQAPFAAACLSTPAGASIAAVRAAFARIGEGTSGRSWSGSASGPGAAASTHEFFRRTGLSRWQQCTVEVAGGTQRVTSIDLREATDFSSCADRGAYPHRFSLCAIADRLAP